MSRKILAIMGRGIQMLKDGLNPTGIESWTLTEDLELCDARSAHLPVRQQCDDSSPFSMIGGGEMNLLAGKILIRELQPNTIVCAYGDRSDYLKLVGGPTESEVMSAALGEVSVPVFTWERERELPGPSNTGREVRNIFDLARLQRIEEIWLVTVGVHVPRTSTYVSKYMMLPEYRQLRPIVLESEEVLLAADRQIYGPRVEAMRSSQSFQRNWAREADGIQKIVRDTYGDMKPKVSA